MTLKIPSSSTRSTNENWKRNNNEGPVDNEKFSAALDRTGEKSRVIFPDLFQVIALEMTRANRAIFPRTQLIVVTWYPHLVMLDGGSVDCSENAHAQSLRRVGEEW
jgi:hypothetical protein